MTTAASYSNLVQDLYVAYFGRPADYFGLQNFEAALAAANAPNDPAQLALAYSTNAAVKTLVDSFGTSAESTALYGSGSTESFVNAIFENLFNRPAAVSGLSFWVNAIETGAVSKGDAALAILAGAESNTSTQGVSDWDLIKNKISVATNFTTDLGTSSTDIVAYSGAAAAQQARLLLASVTVSTDATTFDVQTTINNIVAGNVTNTYSLTTGVDTLVGGTGNNVFNAVLDNTAGLAAGGQAATLQSFDTITGGTLNNTLNITDFGTGSWMSIPSGASITGVTTLNINSLEGIAGTTSPGFSVYSALDLSGWTDLTAFNIKSSNNYYNIVKVGDNTAVNIVTNGSSSEYVLTFGGSTINLDNTSGVFIYNAVTGGKNTTAVTIANTGTDESENYVYDLHNSGNQGYDGGGTTPGWSAGANSITTVSLSGQNSSVISTNYIYSDALTTLNLTDSSHTSTYVNAGEGARALTVNLSNDGNGAAGEYFVQDLTATSFTVNATGTATNNFGAYLSEVKTVTFNDAVDVNFYQGTIAGQDYLYALEAKSVTINGAGGFTADLSGLAAGAAINASGSSGVITVEMASASGGDATQSFTGGTGQDIVTVGATQTGAVAGGAATNNEIILANAPAATEADLGSYSNFAILGVSGTTSGTFDMAKYQGYSAFDVQSSGGNVSFTNAATNATLSLEGGNSNVITLRMADGTGATDSTTLTLGTTSSTWGDYTQVTLEDSGFVGIATVNLVSNTLNSGSSNGLGTLGDNNWVTLNISGFGGLNIGSNIVDSASLTINNTSVSTGTISAAINTLTDNSLTSLTIKGSGGLEIVNFDSTSTSLSLVDNDTSAFYISHLNDTALTSATFTNSVNTTAGTFVVGHTLSDAGLATLNLNGNVGVTVVGDAVTSGITVAGGTDNATVSFTSVGATASGKTDNITLGNGDADTVVLGAGVAGSTQTVVLGSGANDSVTSTSVGSVSVTVGSSTAGTDSITADSASVFHATAGNGTNVISDTAAGASTVISVGTGANSITVGGDMTGTSVSGTISFGTHASTVVDSVTLGESGSATTTVTGLEKISGLNNNGADTLTFASDAGTVASMQQITPSEVAAAGGDTTLLASWIAAATGAAGSGVTTAAHSISWFTYQSNTYLVEMVGADAGTLAAVDTVVELTGTGYTFAKTTFAAGGVVHLMG